MRGWYCKDTPENNTSRRVSIATSLTHSLTYSLTHSGIYRHTCMRRLAEALHTWRLHFLRFHNMPKLSLQSPYIKLAVEALRRSYRTNIRIGVYSSRRKLRGKSKLSPLSPKRKTTNGVSAASFNHYVYGMPVEVILRLIDRKIKLSLYW